VCVRVQLRPAHQPTLLCFFHSTVGWPHTHANTHKQPHTRAHTATQARLSRRSTHTAPPYPPGGFQGGQASQGMLIRLATIHSAPLAAIALNPKQPLPCQAGTQYLLFFPQHPDPLPDQPVSVRAVRPAPMAASEVGPCALAAAAAASPNHNRFTSTSRAPAPPQLRVQLGCCLNFNDVPHFNGSVLSTSTGQRAPCSGAQPIQGMRHMT
jgi:hypothetical protein